MTTQTHMHTGIGNLQDRHTQQQHKKHRRTQKNEHCKDIISIKQKTNKGKDNPDFVDKVTKE